MLSNINPDYPLSHFIVSTFGSYGGYYGRGKTLQEARDECYKAGAEAGSKVVMYAVDKNGRVDNYGGISYFSKVDLGTFVLTPSSEVVEECNE